MFDEISSIIHLSGQTYQVIKAGVISGVAVKLSGCSQLPSLHQSLYTALLMSNHVLVMIGAICSAVFVHDNDYYFFDLHSHGHDGLSDPDGRSILIAFSSLENLVSYMYALYDSMGIDLNCQFEIVPVSFKETFFDTLHIEDSQRNIKQQTVKQKRINLPQQLENTSRSSQNEAINKSENLFVFCKTKTITFTRVIKH